MFGFLGFLWVSIGALPLIITFIRLTKIEKNLIPKRIRNGVIILLADVALLIAINVFFYYYTEILWFIRLGFEGRFLTSIYTQGAMFAAGFLIAFAFLYANLRYAQKKLAASAPRGVYLVAVLIISVIHGVAVSGIWYTYLLFANQAPSTLVDPLWGKPVGFYLFDIPFYTAVLDWVTWLIISSFLINFIPLFITPQVLEKEYLRSDDFKQKVARLRIQWLFLLALIFVIYAAYSYLNIYNMMLTRHGVVSGVDFVDNNYRAMGLSITIFVYLATALVLFCCLFIPRLRKLLLKKKFSQARGTETFAPRVFIVPGSVAALLIVFNFVIPSLLGSLVVNPNEITVEKPYIANSIDFTRRAYNIHGESMDERLYNVDTTLRRSVIEENEGTLDNVRLWDWRALMDNLKEQQEIRSYYSFHDVDIDRYMIGDRYRQVMLSVRELDKRNLDPNSQTWVSLKLKYTHGMGLVLLPAHEFLEEGKPKLLIKNIPPETGSLFTITRPQIYYGEETNDQVYVHSKEKEFDYPLGDTNVYTQYMGKGGVPLNSFFNRFAYALKFDDYRMLFSTYFTDETKVLFRRNILERLRTIAPFLIPDGDPYAVLTADGRIMYIIDTYFISDSFPYSEKYNGVLSNFHGINYIRNSVKVTVDAYDGTIKFYIMDKNDILLATHMRIFPGLFSPYSEMPADIKKHIRYPEDLFTIQADMYSTYHMEEPEVFYQREDVWTFATERYRQDFQNVVPYYVMIQFPGDRHVEFVLMVPFTPKNKNVINAWMAGRCDIPHYGELVVYKFPKGVEVLGPRQIEARIDQNTEMSQDMTLWGQRGSEVIRGNLLAIPLFSSNALTIFYAEPIFLQAEDAKLPEMKRVALADQADVVWDQEFSVALKKLVGDITETAPQPTAQAAALPNTAAANRLRDLLAQIQDAFDSYKSLAAQGRFAEAGQYLDKINELMQNRQ